MSDRLSALDVHLSTLPFRQIERILSGISKSQWPDVERMTAWLGTALANGL